jgi:MATE family multidrug resistance protein
MRQGLFAIPTQIIVIVAPINVVLNYMLGAYTSHSPILTLTFDPVWGPEKIRLGFIGAPIATAVSFNLVSLMSICYGIYYVPHTAWHPLSSRMFTNLGVLVQLGLAGVGTSIDFSSNFRINGSFGGILVTGQTATEWWAWELVALAASL